MTTRLLTVLFVLLLPCLVRAGNVTCVNDVDTIPSQVYMVSGRITLSSSYATGGDTFSTNNTLSDVAACLCHSGSRSPLTVWIENEKASAGTPVLFEYDATNRKILGFSLVTATLFGQAQTNDTQLVSTSNVSTITLRFMAFCS